MTNKKPKKPTRAEIRRLELGVLRAAEVWFVGGWARPVSARLVNAIDALRAAKARAAK